MYKSLKVVLIIEVKYIEVNVYLNSKCNPNLEASSSTNKVATDQH